MKGVLAALALCCATFTMVVEAAYSQVPQARTIAAHAPAEPIEFTDIVGYRLKISDLLLVAFTGLLWLATWRLARSAEKTAMHQLSAYIEVDIESLDWVAAPNRLVEVVLRVKNVGQTPAYDLVTKSWVDVRPWPHPTAGNFVGPESTVPSPSIINPAQSRRAKTGSVLPLPADAATAIADGSRIRFYVYGSTTYRDAFRRKRHTNFCFAIAGRPGVTCDIAYCNQHNDAT